MAFKHFNHLNVPESWERYFTKYPQGMSILEALFEWVSQVDSMVDNQNKLNDNVAQFRKEIDAFVARFDDRLQTEVTQTLSDWQNSGFLDVVISEALQWQLTNYITTNEADKLSITQQLSQTAANIKNFGAVGDGVADDTQAYNNAQGSNYHVIMPKATYKMTKFQGQDYQHIDGRGSTIQLYQGSSPVLVGFRNNSMYENIVFECMETDLEWTRASVEDMQNVIFRNCTFKGFRNPTKSNAWGLYMKRSKNIMVINCRFGNNTQSDIAILEGCENITVINAMGLEGETILPVINIEPNRSIPEMRNVRIANTDMKMLYLLENDIGYSAKNVVIEACTINELVYDGSNVEFIGCRILKVRNAPVSGRIYGGQLGLNDSLTLGKNIFEDSRLLSISRSDIASNWAVQYSTIPNEGLYRRTEDNTAGRFLRLNPQNTNGVIQIRTKNRVPVSGGDCFLLGITGRANYPTGSGFRGQNMRVRFYDLDGEIVLTQIVMIFKTQDNGLTPLATESAVLVTPSGATEMEIQIGSFSTTTNGLDIVSTSLHRIVVSSGIRGNTKQFEHIHQLTTGHLETTISDEPDLVNNRYYANLSKGDKWLLENPQPSGYLGYVCTDDTQAKPVMKGFGMIEG